MLFVMGMTNYRMKSLQVKHESLVDVLFVRNIWKPHKTSSDPLYLSLLPSVNSNGANMKVHPITKLNSPSATCIEENSVISKVRSRLMNRVQHKSVTNLVYIVILTG